MGYKLPVTCAHVISCHAGASQTHCVRKQNTQKRFLMQMSFHLALLGFLWFIGKHCFVLYDSTWNHSTTHWRHESQPHVCLDHLKCTFPPPWLCFALAKLLAFQVDQRDTSLRLECLALFPACHMTQFNTTQASGSPPKWIWFCLKRRDPTNAPSGSLHLWGQEVVPKKLNVSYENKGKVLSFKPTQLEYQRQTWKRENKEQEKKKCPSSCIPDEKNQGDSELPATAGQKSRWSLAKCSPFHSKEIKPLS